MAFNPSQDYWDALAAGNSLIVFADDKVQEILLCKLDLKTASKLLKLLTQTVSQGVNDTFPYDDNIQTIIKYLLECIEHHSPSVDVSIISCVYYISKYFITKGKLEIALNLKTYFKKFKIDNTKDVLKVYYACFYDLHTFVEHKSTNLGIDEKLKIRYESLDILSYCHVNYLRLLLSVADNFVNNEKVSENPNLHLKYAIDVLKLTKSILKESIINVDCELVCRSYAQFVTNLVINILKVKNSVVTTVVEDIEVIQTSNENCNKVMHFFVMALKAILNPELSGTSISQLTITLQHLMDHESRSLLFSYCYRLASIYFSVVGHWLCMATLLSFEEFVTVSEVAMLLSSYLKKNITLEQTLVEPSSVAYMSFKVIVNFISLGVNIFFDSVANHDNAEGPRNKVLKQLNAIQTLCYNLLIILRSYGVPVWKDSWKIFVIRTVKLAAVLERKEYFNQASEFYHKLCSGFFELEPFLDSKESIICSEDLIYKAFKGLCQCLIHLTKYEEALFCLSIAVIVMPNSCRGLQRLWYSSKRESLSRNVNTQSFSIINYIREPKFSEMFPDVLPNLHERLNGFISCHLLAWELESYLFNRSDKMELYDSICVVGRELMKILCDSIMFCEGIELVLSSTWMKYSIYKEEFSAMHEKGIEIVMKLQQQVPDNDKWCLFLSLGNIQFYRFFAQVTVLREKLQNDVLEMKNQFPSKLEHKIMKGFIDPSDAEMKSNIITIYSDLNVEKEQEDLDILVKALDAWENLCYFGENFPECPQYKIDTLLLNVKIAAHVFALYGYHLHSLRSWMAYYNLCRFSGNLADSLLALSELLKFNRNICDSEFQKEANRIEVEIQKNDLDAKQKEMLFTYYLTKSSCCLINNECDIGWQYLQKVNETSIPSTYKGQLIFAQKHLLVSKYYLHRHDFSDIPADFDESSAFLSMIRALKILKALHLIGKTDSLLENCSLHLVMMEAAEWSGDLCLGMKFYRDGYAHLKTYLTLAQQLGLASRCSQIISKLVQFDIMCHEVDNAEVKLLGLEAILCLSNESLSSTYRVEALPKENFLDVADDFCLDTDMVRMKLLDVATPRRANIMASPELVKSPFKMPQIATHKPNCVCLFCQCLLVHNSLIEVTLLKAQLHILKGENDLALSYFKGGITLGKKLKVHQKNLLRNFSKSIYGKSLDSYFFLSDPLSFSLSKLFMSYGEFMLLCSRHEEVQNIITHSHNSLLDSQECNLHIICEMFDIAQVLHSEIKNKTAVLNGICVGIDSENTDLENCIQDSSKITGTPKVSKICAVNPPILNRNEDHLHLSKTVSPSIIVKLDSKIECTKTEEEADIAMKRGRNIATCINFNDSNDDSTLEVNKPNKINVNEKSLKSHPGCTDNTIIINSSASSDEIDVCHNKEIEIISCGLEDIAISSAKQSFHTAQITEKVGAITSKLVNRENLTKEKAKSHSTRKLKAKVTKVQDEYLSQDIPAGLPKSDETIQRTKYENTSVLNSSGFNVSLVEHRSLLKVKCPKKPQDGGKTLKSSAGTKVTKRKPKSVLQIDLSDSNLSTSDILVESCSNPLKELNFQSRDECEIPEEETNQNTSRMKQNPSENKCALTNKRNNKKVSKKACGVPIVNLESSDNENSPEDKCTTSNREHILFNETECTKSSSFRTRKKITGFISPESNKTLSTNKNCVVNSCAFETPNCADSSAVVKTKVSTASKKMSRKKRNPYVYY